MVNVRVSKSFDFQHKTIKQAILESEKKLKSKGRLLVRPSGTEPVIRIMAESPDEAMVVTEINKLSEIIKNHN
jgi:phosphoglucosamine mutase